MDIATIAGIVSGILLIVSAIGSKSLVYFVDVTSFLIVLGGTFAAFMVNYPFKDLASLVGILLKTVFSKSYNTDLIIQQILDFASITRKEGLLSLESKLDTIDNPFLRRGLRLAVDGTEPQLIYSILDTDIKKLKARHKNGIEMIQTLGAFAPAFGMIGTLVGLVLMLQQLEDPSTIGPSMAIALITTFYGALVANLVFLPMAGKLKKISSDETLILELIIEGVISITEGTNPRVIEQHLNSFIQPKSRKEHF